MKIISKHLWQLEELSLLDCPVFDSGVKSLIPGNNGHRGCPKLKKLWLGNLITIRALVHLLHGLPLLVFLSHQSMLDALSELCRESHGKDDLVCTSLRHLIKDASVDMAVEFEPVSNLLLELGRQPHLYHQITHVEIILIVKHQQEVGGALCLLTELTSLCLVNVVSFENVVKPIIELRGAQLHTLNLTRLHTVDIQKIIDGCKNLINLTLRRDEQSLDPEPYDTPLLVPQPADMPHLRTLLLGGYNESQFTADQALTILSIPTLTDITLIDFHILNDVVMDRLLGAEPPTFRPFRDLQTLKLVRCKCVNPSSILRLVTSPNNKLKTLVIYKCSAINKRTDSQLMADIAAFQYELRVTNSYP